MLDRVARLLGNTPTTSGATTVRVRAVVEQGRSWSVALETQSSSGHGSRTIEAASCQGLAEATALIVALMIDPDAAQRAGSETASATTSSAPSPASAATPPAPPNSTAHTVSAALPSSAAFRKGPTGLVAIHVAANVGTLGSAELGVGGGLGVAFGPWRIELRGTYGLVADYRVAASTPPGAYGEFHLIAGTLAGCLDVGRDVAWGGCLDVEAGVIHADGGGATRNFHPDTPWIGLGGGAFIAPRIGDNFSLPIHLDLVVPIRRPVFVIENTSGSVFQPAVVGGRATIGAEVRF